MQLKDLGERAIVRDFLTLFEIPDDDVYVDSSKGLMLKVDGFRLDYTAGDADLYDMGWKAVTSVISDLISRGGRPIELLLSVGVPKDLDYSVFSSLASAVKDASDYYNVKVVGGDTNEGNWIDLFGIAEPMCYKPARKVNSKAVLIISEPIGYTETVFNTNKGKNTIFGQKLVHPVLRTDILEFFSQFCEKIYYSTDISDGLFVALHNIARRLKVKVVMTQLPLADEVRAAVSAEPLEFLSKGGEDYATIILLNNDVTDSALSFLEYLGLRPQVIGYTIPGSGVEFEGVEVPERGWDSFKGWI